MVAVNGRSSLTVSDLVGRHHRAIAAPGDVSCPSGAKTAVDAALADMGGLDLLVCNVGGGDSVQPGKETPEEWQRVFALNLWSTTNVVEAARYALADGGGSVVCISSICGSTVVEGAPLTYSVAKAALHAYVRGIAATILNEVGLDVGDVRLRKPAKHRFSALTSAGAQTTTCFSAISSQTLSSPFSAISATRR